MPTLRIPDTFETYPTNRTLGIIDDADNADRLVDALVAMDLDKDLWVLTGVAAHNALDPDGTNHGLYVRFVRKLQQLGYVARHLAEYTAAADDGAWVISVQLPSDGARKRAVHDLFERYGGRNLRYFGRSTIEDLHRNAPVLAEPDSEPTPGKPPASTEAVRASHAMLNEGAPPSPPRD